MFDGKCPPENILGAQWYGCKMSGNRERLNCDNHGPNNYKDTKPKGRLFLKIDLKKLAADVICLRPPPLCYTLYKYVPLYSSYSHREGGGRSTSEKVTGALVHKRGRKYQHD